MFQASNIHIQASLEFSIPNLRLPVIPPEAKGVWMVCLKRDPVIQTQRFLRPCAAH